MKYIVSMMTNTKKAETKEKTMTQTQTQTAYAYVQVLHHGDTPDSYSHDPGSLEGPWEGTPEQIIADLSDIGGSAVPGYTGTYWERGDDLWVEAA